MSGIISKNIDVSQIFFDNLFTGTEFLSDLDESFN